MALKYEQIMVLISFSSSCLFDPYSEVPQAYTRVRLKRRVRIVMIAGCDCNCNKKIR